MARGTGVGVVDVAKGVDSVDVLLGIGDVMVAVFSEADVNDFAALSGAKIGVADA